MRPVSGEPVEITSDNVEVGDVITIGDQPFRVTDVISLYLRAKRIRFSSGETFTMHGQTRLSAVRPARPFSSLGEGEL